MSEEPSSPHQPPGAPDALAEAFAANLKTVENLPELEMRAAAVGQALRGLAAREAAWWMDQLLRGSLWGRQAEVDAMMACTRWLLTEQVDKNYALFKEIFEAAHAEQRLAILAILRDPPPHQKLLRGQQMAPPALDLGRDVTVGERRSLARGNDRRILERLLLDPNRLVVEQLLQNPRLLEQDVLQIASARPNLPDVLRTIALHKTWFLRPEVRFTLVMNPYARTGLGLKLLPTLNIDKLRQVRNATHLHPMLPETAALLVELREQRTAPWRV